MLAEPREIARTRASRVDASRDRALARVHLGIDAKRRASPVDMRIEIDQARGDDEARYILDRCAVASRRSAIAATFPSKSRHRRHDRSLAPDRSSNRCAEQDQTASTKLTKIAREAERPSVVDFVSRSNSFTRPSPLVRPPSIAAQAEASPALTVENMDRLPWRGQRHRAPGVRPSQSAEVAFSWSATCTSR